MWYTPIRLRDIPGMILKDTLRHYREKVRKKTDPWQSNRLQFVRLLAELNAVGLTSAQYSELAGSMNLNVEDIDELLERAEIEWEHLKHVRCL